MRPLVSTKIKVISLPTAHERRSDFAAHARSARSNWSFVDAMTDAPPELPYFERQAQRKFGRKLTRGEVGCFASHWAEWDALLKSDEDQRIIMEDDVIVDWNALDVIAETDFSAFDIDLLRLYATHPIQYRVEVTRFLGPHIHLLNCRGMFLGSQGYVLTRRAAARMVSLATSVDMPVDWFMNRYWEFGFPNYCLFPFPLIERSTPSHIGDRSEFPPIDRSTWFLRQGFRLLDRASRGIADHIRFRASAFSPNPDAGPSYVERTKAAIHSDVNG